MGQAATDPICQMIQQYEKIHPNVRIDVNVVAWDDYWTKLPLSLKGNKNAPVLFNVHNSYDALIRPHMEPYDIPLEDLETDYTFVDTHVDENGEVKYIDSVINTGAIFYNKDLWAEAGLTEADIPTTWDELIEVAQKLTKFDGDTMVQAGFNINGSYKAAWQGLNYQKGVLMFQEDGHTANYDCETTKENLEFLQSLYDEYQVGAVNFGDDRELSFRQQPDRDDLRLGLLRRHVGHQLSGRELRRLPHAGVQRGDSVRVRPVQRRVHPRHQRPPER